MRTVENFTNGSRVSREAEISLCPSCGRAGILEYLADGVPEFVHVEIEDVLSDGMLVEPIDSCALPS